MRGRKGDDGDTVVGMHTGSRASARVFWGRSGTHVSPASPPPKQEKDWERGGAGAHSHSCVVGPVLVAVLSLLQIMSRDKGGGAGEGGVQGWCRWVNVAGLRGAVQG